MATVTSFTAARMQAIEDNAVVGGSVVGNNLILTRNDGTQINAGPVIGPQGIQGVPGEVTDAELMTAIAGVNTSIAAGPLGLLNLAEASTDQTIGGFTADVWHDVNGSFVTVTCVANRYYHFTGTCSRMSDGAGTGFDMRIIRVGGTPIAAGYAYAPGATKTVPISADRAMVVPGGWAGSQTFKLQTRHNTDQQSYVMGTGYSTSLSVIDLGAV